MLPHESKLSSSLTTVIKYEPDDDIDIKLEFKKEKEDILQPVQFISGAEEIKNVDCDTKTVELNSDLKEEKEDDNDQNPCIKTKSTKSSSSSRIPDPVQAEAKTVDNNNCGLKCPYCSREFPTRQKLRNHKRVHNTKYFCTLCEFKGISSAALNIHFRTHTKEKPWKCKEPQCKKSYTSKQSLEYHEFSIHGKKEKQYKIWRCSLCPFKSIHKSNVKDHQNSVHLRLKRFKCPQPLCPYKCTFKSNLTSHTQRAHSQNKPFKCPESGTGTRCEYATKTKQSLKRHLKVTHERSMEEIETILQNEIQLFNSSPVTTQQTQSQMTIKPPEEKDETSININTTTTELKCPSCYKKFPTRQKLTMHMRNHNRKFKCIVCEFKGITPQALQLHFRIHTGDKPWKCKEPQCQMSYIKKQGLISHQLSQHGKRAKQYKIFRCELCPFKSIYNAPLQQHWNSVHKGLTTKQQQMRKTQTKPEPQCTKNGKEIEPELIELKYEVQEENWVDESEQNPIINPKPNPTATPANTTMRLTRLARVPLTLSLPTFDNPSTSRSQPHNKNKESKEKTSNNNNSETEKNNINTKSRTTERVTTLRMRVKARECPKCEKAVRLSDFFHHLNKCSKKSTPSNFMEPQKEKQLSTSNSTTSTTTTTSGSSSSRSTRIGNLQAVFVNGQTHFIPVSAPIRDEKDCDSNRDEEFSSSTSAQMIHNKDQVKSDPQEFSCHLCDFKTDQSHLLTLHLPVHVKTRPWRCTEPNCDYNTSYMKTFIKHQRTRHGKNTLGSYNDVLVLIHPAHDK